jgi:ABC-type Fe3+-hydroxamate transport system substrate-binding protein
MAAERALTEIVNSVAAAAAVGLSLWLGTVAAPSRARHPTQASAQSASVEPVTLPDGTRALNDARGVAVPLKRYSHIISISTVADSALLELCEPTRVAGFSAFSHDSGLGKHRFQGQPAIATGQPLASVMALEPDLLLAHGPVTGWSAQLEALGVPVFDLGDLHGVSTFSFILESVGWFCERPAAGRTAAHHFRRRLARVAPTPDGNPRPSGLYLGHLNNQVFGGAAGTSYHDVLEAAGLRDAAAHFDAWPSYRNEELAALDPDYIVTGTGQGAALCQLPQLAALRACIQNAVLEVDPASLNDPGFGMLDAAEQLAEALRAKTR